MWCRYSAMLGGCSTSVPAAATSGGRRHAICLPTIDFVALEPVHKKHAFLKAAVRELALHNLTPLAERLDVHTPRDYDVAMSRATFDLREWLELGASYVRADGLVFGFEAIPRADLPNVERHSYAVGSRSRQWSLVVFHVQHT